MNYIRINNLRSILRDTRGAGVLSYALLLGGLAVLLTYGVQRVSTAVNTSLSSQGAELEAIADDGSGAGASGSSSSSGTSGSTASKGKGKGKSGK